MKRRPNELSSIHPTNFSSGEVGDYETHFTDKDVAEQFDEWLKKEEGKSGLKFKYTIDK